MLSSILKSSRNNISKFVQCNAFSTISSTKENPGRVVFISQSLDAVSNLAFEDWLYKNWNFGKRNVLFLWRNSPCVVIGRHQNPYNEANLEYLDIAGVPIVRRNSGGGTVYHDEGNVNCTFFTARDRYSRRNNLDIICTALQRDFNIPAGINTKDDIVIGGGLKASGTAAKLGRLSAYHHCTILVSADKQQLSLALKGDKTLSSKATKSVPSTVTNLVEICPNLTVERVIGSIGKTYLEQLSSKDNNAAANYAQSDGFTLVCPTEEWFPGLDALKSKLVSWEWLYGMTPLFKQTRPVAVDKSFSEGSTVLLSVEVYHGIIKKLTVESKVGQTLRDVIENHIGESLVGGRYSPDVFMDLESRLIMREANKERVPVASARVL